MARLFTSGFENSLAADGWTIVGGTPTLVTSPVNSGNQSCQINALSEQVGHQVGFDTSESSWYTRHYVNVSARPSAGTFCAFVSIHLDSGAELWRCTLKDDGTLQARISVTTDVGSPSAALTLDTWYVLETRTLRRAAGNDEIEARVYLATTSPAPSFVVSTGTDIGWGSGPGRMLISANTAAATFYADDVAINDSTGATDNSWPGPLFASVMTRSFQPMPFM